MKYFLDTELHEYKKKPLFGKAIDTIELISIGIVSEDFEDINSPKFTSTLEDVGGFIGKKHKVNFEHTQREYYAICKDFDIKAAWDNEWLRENVLKPIHVELSSVDGRTGMYGSFKDFKRLLNKYGKTRKQIAEEIIKFVDYKEKPELGKGFTTRNHLGAAFGALPDYSKPEFYAYYADYDWVVFCWLFGRMIDLPTGFPMYCNDLKQTLDSELINIKVYSKQKLGSNHATTLRDKCNTLQDRLNYVETIDSYPKQTNEHNALADAKWNKELYNFINSL